MSSHAPNPTDNSMRHRRRMLNQRFGISQTYSNFNQLQAINDGLCFFFTAPCYKQKLGLSSSKCIGGRLN
jgi:hypothetical protein